MWNSLTGYVLEQIYAKFFTGVDISGVDILGVDILGRTLAIDSTPVA